MNTIRLLVLLIAYIYSDEALASACVEDRNGQKPKPLIWQTDITGIQFVERVLWEGTCVKQAEITAIRVDPEKFEFALMDAVKSIESVDQKLNRGGVFFDPQKRPVRFGPNIATIGYVFLSNKDPIVIAPANWWLETDPVEPDGYLKVNGTPVSETFAKNQSAVICLDNNSKGETIILPWHYYQTGYYSYSNWGKIDEGMLSRRSKFQKCKNTFQTSPWIVEDEQERKQLLQEYGAEKRFSCLDREIPQAGVCGTSNNPTKRQRVVIASDRRASGNKNKYYLIYFHTELSFVEIQSILLSDAFYSDAKPGWAINLAGGERAGIFANISRTRIRNGNIESDLPSVLVVRQTRP